MDAKKTFDSPDEKSAGSRAPKGPIPATGSAASLPIFAIGRRVTGATK